MFWLNYYLLELKKNDEQELVGGFGWKVFKKGEVYSSQTYYNFFD